MVYILRGGGGTDGANIRSSRKHTVSKLVPTSHPFLKTSSGLGHISDEQHFNS